MLSTPQPDFSVKWEAPQISKLWYLTINILPSLPSSPNTSCENMSD